ncbi:Heparinase ii iii family protein [Favolaschia claudopus]|uniref:Heparinase ii iii family protein n=1 Tax=Favolaschia claudopus TaxID=2862362 RepID=A0AAW0DRJ9_9AGAR
MEVNADLVNCLSKELLGLLRFVWFQRLSASTILFSVARYAGMASTVVTLSQTPTTSLLIANLSTAALTAILAVRTWAIWERRRSVLIFLGAISVGAVVANAIMIGRGVSDTHVASPEMECTMILNSRSDAYLITYVVVIAYETITTILSIFRIVQWRRQIAPSTQTPLLDTLWNDALGIGNILIILHGTAAVRTGGAQLQTSLHSVLSTRIILRSKHLAKVGRPRRRLRSRTTSTDVSSLFTPTTLLLVPEDSSLWDHNDELEHAY